MHTFMQIKPLKNASFHFGKHYFPLDIVITNNYLVWMVLWSILHCLLLKFETCAYFCLGNKSVNGVYYNKFARES